MTETEKSTRTIAELETEQATLTAELQALAERVNAAAAHADAAAAHAGRHPSPAADAASTAAEEQRQALESQIRRKRAALAACERDLTEARQALAEAQKGALFIQLQSALDAIIVAAGAIDVDPMTPELWAELWQRIATGQSLYRQAGGTGRDWIQSPQWVRGQLFAAYATRIDWVLGGKAEAPKAIPTMATLLGLDRAGGLVRELMGAS